VIKISPGLYQDNIYINKPGLVLEPKDKVGDIIIVVQSRPAIHVDLKEGDTC
jgi:F-box protein 11